MNLPEYIRTVGEDVAAKKFGASVWTIRAWRQQAKFPRASKAAEIVALTDGIVDMGGIYTKLTDDAVPEARKAG